MFRETGSWQATLELAEINAPHGFMIYYRSDVTAVMAGSPSFWKATQYLMGNHTIAERMFRHDPSVMLHAPLRTLLYADPDGDTKRHGLTHGGWRVSPRTRRDLWSGGGPGRRGLGTAHRVRAGARGAPCPGLAVRGRQASRRSNWIPAITTKPITQRHMTPNPVHGLSRSVRPGPG